MRTEPLHVFMFAVLVFCLGGIAAAGYSQWVGQPEPAPVVIKQAPIVPLPQGPSIDQLERREIFHRSVTQPKAKLAAKRSGGGKVHYAGSRSQQTYGRASQGQVVMTPSARTGGHSNGRGNVNRERNIGRFFDQRNFRSFRFQNSFRNYFNSSRR